MLWLNPDLHAWLTFTERMILFSFHNKTMANMLMSPCAELCPLLSAACEASLLRVFSTQTQLQPEEAEDRD